MNIVVLGAGALGAYFGARWQEAGQNVTYLVRSRRAKQLREHGLHIQSVQGDYEVNTPKIVEQPEDIDSADLVLLAVKGYHLPSTYPALDVLVEKGAKILPILNGNEHFDVLQERYGVEKVLGGLAFIIATLNENGHVVHTSKAHDMVFGALHPSQTELCEQLQQISEPANFSNTYSDNIQEAIWNKYMFIHAFSGITTASNLSIGEIWEQTETLNIAYKLLEEMKELANASGVSITTKHVEAASENLHKFHPEATSSMHQDRRKGLPLEVEHIHGGALRQAKKVGLTLPYTETIYGLIKPFDGKNN
ncbi:ketopantoate reductase family protein [Radiobacillus kanasensis]|uniref:ketopantoate reductase family protein n=1 Tax=Radiobacillus kanasensis TaxID=2844358 RepID=UPI001E5B3074|nr:ketopantoate reductase family protein [Radiobacillus kanasensis]UFT98503.1 ketopantoate reductase family protein [Radiobacillus kanasensis]